MLSLGFLAAVSAGREGSGEVRGVNREQNPGLVAQLCSRSSDCSQSCVQALLLPLDLLCEEREFYTLSLESLARVFLGLCPVRSLRLGHLEDPETEISGIWDLAQPAVVDLAS